MHFAIDGDRFGFYLAANVSVFTNRQDAVGIDFPFDLPVDEKFFLELDRAFDFDIAREDVFATVICHRFWFIDRSEERRVGKECRWREGEYGGRTGRGAW